MDWGKLPHCCLPDEATASLRRGRSAEKRRRSLPIAKEKNLPPRNPGLDVCYDSSVQKPVASVHQKVGAIDVLN